MTDNDKKTNQKTKSLKGKRNPDASIIDGEQANLALSIKAFRGLTKKIQRVMIINYLQMLRQSDSY